MRMFGCIMFFLTLKRNKLIYYISCISTDGCVGMSAIELELDQTIASMDWIDWN